MKKLIYTATVAVAITLTGAAQADDTFKPYIGFDLQRTMIEYNDVDLGGGDILHADTIMPDALNGFNIHVGARLRKYFGAEFGYFRTKEEGEDIDATDIIGTSGGAPATAGAAFSTNLKMQGFTLDALGYLPLGEQENFELIGTAGVSWSKAEADMIIPGFGTASFDESEIGYRLGGGAQYHFTDNLSLRGLVRYQSANFDDVADNTWVYSAGLNFSF